MFPAHTLRAVDRSPPVEERVAFPGEQALAVPPILETTRTRRFLRRNLHAPLRARGPDQNLQYRPPAAANVTIL